MSGKRTKRIGFLSVFLIICIIVGIFVVKFIRERRIADVITVEAGYRIPDANVFYEGQANVTYVTDVSAIPVHSPGIYDIEINVNGKIYHTKIEVKDSIAPKGIVKTVDLYEGETAKAEDFFESIDDVSDVSVTFKKEPDFSARNSQTVTLLLSDASGNVSEYETTLWISKLKGLVQIEATNEKLDITKLLKPNATASNLSLISGPDLFNQVGEHPIQVNVDGDIYESIVEVIDTIPPNGSTVPHNAWVGDVVEPKRFISEIDDITSVFVSYNYEPDVNIVGEQTVSLILTDEGGNETILESTLITEKDLAAPKIYGAKKATAYIGTPFSYKKGVYAEDNKDGEVDVNVDNSQVNLKSEGEYIAIYSAVDSSGNKTTQEVTITVKNQTVTMDELENIADQVLAEITTEDMTLREKAWEIYQYVNTHLTYTGFSDKTDWMKEAQSGIVKGVGDCFTYYSMSHLLLNRIGIQTLSVERASKPDETRHFWHMVNYGEGWYHFDACIHIPPIVSFMLTDEELDAYSRRHKDSYYYRYDKENYPATSQE